MSDKPDDLIWKLQLCEFNAKKLQTSSASVRASLVVNLLRIGRQCCDELEAYLREQYKTGAPYEFNEKLLKMEAKWKEVEKALTRYNETVDNEKIKHVVTKRDSTLVDLDYVADYLEDLERALNDCEKDCKFFCDSVATVVAELEKMEWPGHVELAIMSHRWRGGLIKSCMPCLFAQDDEQQLVQATSSTSYNVKTPISAASSTPVYGTGRSTKNSERQDRFNEAKRCFALEFRYSQQLKDFCDVLSYELGRIKSTRLEINSRALVKT